MKKSDNGPIYSPRTIKKLTQWMKDEVAKVMRLQREGVLPCCCIIQKFIIETNDIQRILGKTERTAQRHMARIRKALGKKPGQFVSIDEFVDKTGIPMEVVRRAMDMIPHRYPTPEEEERFRKGDYRPL